MYHPNNYSLDENNVNYKNRIVYIKEANGAEYIRITENNKGPLYDCSGNYICNWAGKEKDKCSTLFDLKKIISLEVLAPK